MRRWQGLIVSLAIFAISACSNTGALLSNEPTPQISAPLAPTIPASPAASQTLPALAECDVVVLNLPERLSDPNFEFSGMAWYGDQLVLLPQYPSGRYFSNDPKIYSVLEEDLLKAIEYPEYELPITDVPLHNSDLSDFVRGYEGFESVLFVDQQIFLTIESHAGDPMIGYLIRGDVNGDLESVTLAVDSLVELKPFSDAPNASFEAMTYWDGKLYIMYEHNSGQLNGSATAYEFNLDLQLEREIAFPPINFRITDATETREDGSFWVMNYFYPGDTHLEVDQDALVAAYGEGGSHARFDPVERLVRFKFVDGGVERVDQPPIYLKLLEGNVARNWEGLVRLSDLGFLMITDSFPDSQLGFCSMLR